MSTPTLAVLIVDDHPIFRKGLRALLASHPELRLVGEATSGHEAVRLADDLHPDLILMDLQMPGGDGINAIRQIIASRPECRILVVTMFDDDDSVFAAMRAGARGYVLKDTDDEELSRALLAVGNGEAIFGAAIAGRMMRFFTQRPAAMPVLFPELSESERRVLELIAQGENNQTIADRLALSPKTIRNYISSIFAKLQVVDRAQAIVKARNAGMTG
ncbi:MAG: response regulator [Oscillochloridaceae bacterium umkhey_bin13]